MQTAINNNPFVFHPTLTVDELSFNSPQPNERRLLPFYLVPRMIVGKVYKPNVFVFYFSYLIDEPPAPIDGYLRPVMIEYGKNSGKILRIIITYTLPDDILRSLETVRILIGEKRESAAKPVMKHYYTLIYQLFQTIEQNLRNSDFTNSPALLQK
jgi:hypothetical protein